MVALGDHVLHFVLLAVHIIDCIPHGYALSNQTRYGHPEERSGHLEGDILVNMNSRNGLSDARTRWPNKVLPFVIDPHYTEAQVRMIYDAADVINSNTCCFVRPRRPNERDFIQIQDGNKGCSSFIGYQAQGQQEMNLADECFGQIGTIIHEFLHCLGFVHQHCSPERNKFIKILWRNIDPAFQNNFVAYPPNEITDFGVAYDPYSVMHYSADAFSRDGEKTIELSSKDTGDERMMGQRQGLTDKDILKLNRMYNCVKV